MLRESLASIDAVEALLREVPAKSGLPKDEDLIAAFAIRRIAPEDRLRRVLEDERARRAAAGSTGTLPAYPLEIPKSGRFLRLAELGPSGTGMVWLAWDVEKRRRVVLKRLAPEGSEAAPETVRDAREAAKLFHPNAVAVVGVTEEKDAAGFPVHRLISEYAEGFTLDQGKMPPDRAARAVRDAALAVHEGHRLGIVHGVLRPRSVRLAADGRIRVADFGQSGVLAGRDAATPGVAWMAPERIRGGGPTPASDVHGLGAILYFLLSGRPPFEGGTPAAIAQGILGGEAAPLGALDANLPAALGTIASRALSPDPLKRYRTAALLAEDLDRFLQGQAPMTDLELLQGHAFALLKTGDLEEGIHLLRELKRRTRTEPEGPLGRARAGLAAACAESRKVVEPRERLDRARSRLCLAVLQFLSNKDPMEMTAGAVLDLEKVLEGQAENSEARLLRGVALLLRARFPGHEDAAKLNLERALEDLTRAAGSEGHRGAALHDRAVATYYLSRMEKTDATTSRGLLWKAVVDLEAAVAADPLHPFARKDLGLLKLAHAKGDPERRKLPSALLHEVLAQLSRAVELCGDLDGALVERGKVLFGLKRYAEAIEDWRRAGRISATRAKEVAPLIAEAEPLVVGPPPVR